MNHNNSYLLPNFYFILALLCLASCKRDVSEAPHLSLSDVASIEAHLGPLPEGGPIEKYVRYYSGRFEDGEYVVTGVFLREGPSGIRLVSYDKLPVVFDGGCSVVTLKYELNTRVVKYIRCNGVA
ncbi:hypothetical protein [Pseudoxanthomonas winnipegensis]|uniref:Uncharacterized protein n=1 Tax=Pseudoxanthomonas winnipegensis TaxID=2480810 RepID=A0A4Q8M545_9GAMM|nr:hypothetical protein [Pseudoxanthomonas winnipegensis]TAA41624.1 hypothetical protein EA655_11850 [Pseudoxanthomonas winnipegensis]